MRCPSNGGTCSVRQISESQERFGDGPARILFECKACGYFVEDIVEKELWPFSPYPIEID